MRLLYLLSILLLSAAPAQAQTCTSAPSCAALGYDKTSSDCTGQAMLKCPFDQSKVFCAGTSACGSNGTSDGSGDCREGYILFSDKTCATGLQPGKTAIGIVFSSVNRLAIAFDETRLAWGGHGIGIGSVAKGASGKSNTAAILAYGKANNISYPAAEYCNSYSTAGTKAGDWFLPSLEELKLLSSSYGVVSGKLMAIIGKVDIEKDEYYWSSSEHDYNYARSFVLSSGTAGYTAKDGPDYVRPVLAF